MLGLSHNGSNKKEMLDSLGRLESLSIKNWDIAFKRYTQIENNTAPKLIGASSATLDLPDKIFIHQGEDIKVRVVVSEWLFDKT